MSIKPRDSFMLDRSAVPLVVILVLPFLACLAILFLVPGIDPALLIDGVKVGAVLIVAGVALSFAARALAMRSGQH
jgi:hypothetical protein